MAAKIFGIDLPSTVINLEFRLGVLERIVTRLAEFAPPEALTDETLGDIRSSVFDSLREHYPEAGLILSAEQTHGRATTQSSEVIFLTLHGNSYSSGRLNLELQNAGAAFNILNFEAKTPGCQVLQWYPRSLPERELLRAPTQLPTSGASECRYEMSVRDRSGQERKFEILVDPRKNPAAYDFIEVR
jgi:hypothetical protein